MAKVVDVTLRLIDELTRPLQTASNSLAAHQKQWEKAAKNITKTGNSIAKVGTTMTKTFTVPIVAAGTAAVKAAEIVETAWTGVIKTVDGTEEQLSSLKNSLNEIALSTGSDISTIYGIAEMGGQLGVATENIDVFTDTIVRLADSTNITAEAAQDIAQLFNIMGTDISLLPQWGSAIVELGNSMATTEQDIVNMATRIGAAGTQIGLSEQEILAYSATMSSLGIAAEAGGTAFSKFTRILDTAVSTNSESLVSWASVAKMSASDFKNLWAKDTNAAIQSVLKGMGEAENLTLLLSDLDIKDTRMIDTLTRMATNADLLGESLNTANSAWAENTALTEESNKRYETFAAKIQQLKNSLTLLGAEFGELIIPYLLEGMEVIRDVIAYISSLDDSTKSMIIKGAAIVAVIGPVLTIFGKVVSGVGTVITVFTKLNGVIQTVMGVFSALKGGATLGAALTGAITPAGWVVAALLAVVAAGVAIYKNWDKIKAAAQALGEKFKAVFASLDGDKLLAGLRTAFDKFLEKVKGVIEAFKLAWSSIKPFLEPIFNFIKDVFIAKVQVAFSAFAGFITGCIQNIKNVINGITTVLGGIITFITGVFTGNWSKAWNGVVSIFGGIFKTIVALIKAPINAVIGIINGAIRGINRIGFDIPSWVPGIGGSKFRINVPTIPMLYKGTENWQGGTAMINEKAYGGEIVDLPNGSRVYPHDESVEKAYKDGASSSGTTITIPKLADSIIVREDADIDRIVNQLVNKLTKATANLGGVMA